LPDEEAQIMPWMKSFRWTLVFAGACLFFSCGGHKRLREVAQKEDDRTEAQVRADRKMKAADAFFDAGDLQSARKECLAALGDDPAQFRAHQSLADIYELESNPAAALMERIAHTEVAPTSKHFLESMLTYVFARFSRETPAYDEKSKEERLNAWAKLSEAVSWFHQKDYGRALKMCEAFEKPLIKLGAVAYLKGILHLNLGQKELATADFVESASRNAYFVRKVLNARMQEALPGLLEQLQGTLQNELKNHPADTESSVMLASIFHNLNQPGEALRICREALAWNNAPWQILFLKAFAHQQLGQTLLVDQTLSDLKEIRGDVLSAFSVCEPSLFNGVLSKKASEFAEHSFADILAEPSRSYFLWRLKEEIGDPDFEKERAFFFKMLDDAYPPGEFNVQDPDAPSQNAPKGIKEYMGWVQDLIESSMERLMHCDLQRSSLRPNLLGRIVLRVDLRRDGSAANVAVEENSTMDDFISGCMIRKIDGIRFPKALRQTETFKVPVLLGPDADVKPEKREAAGNRNPP
jgi:hypothetical protein